MSRHCQAGKTCRRDDGLSHRTVRDRPIQVHPSSELVTMLAMVMIPAYMVPLSIVLRIAALAKLHRDVLRVARGSGSQRLGPTTGPNAVLLLAWSQVAERLSYGLPRSSLELLALRSSVCDLDPRRRRVREGTEVQEGLPVVFIKRVLIDPPEQPQEQLPEIVEPSPAIERASPPSFNRPLANPPLGIV